MSELCVEAVKYEYLLLDKKIIEICNNYIRILLIIRKKKEQNMYGSIKIECTRNKKKYTYKIEDRETKIIKVRKKLPNHFDNMIQKIK